jgi:succinate-semialdehyde dehydrogenase / glutarate-semialdehyde dehydrogenase
VNLRNPGLLRQQALIDGHWRDGRGGETVDVRDPAIARVIARVPRMGQVETAEAITAADRALPAWKALGTRGRGAALRRWHDLVQANLDDLAALMVAEQGKPFAEARGEVAYAATFIDWFAEEGKRAFGEALPVSQADRRMLVLHDPIGVCCAITPWNFPSAMVTRKAGAALAAGCTMVLKPAEQTPLSALALAHLALEAGIPPGVLSVVTGSAADAPAIGLEMTTHPLVRLVSFTGSTAVGKLLLAQAAGTVKKLGLELGGNTPFIVFDDADLGAAVAGAMQCKFRNAGQTCVCANRILVHDSLHDAFAERLVQATRRLQVASGHEPGAQIGPLIDGAAVDKVHSHVTDAVARGARVLCGGRVHERGGTFYEPTVLDRVTPDMLIAREETFGPVAPLMRFRDEDEAVALANDTEYGLAACFYAENGRRILRVMERLAFGIVGINTGLLSTELAPVGGTRQSGLGREGGRLGLHEFLEPKYVCIGVTP